MYKHIVSTVVPTTTHITSKGLGLGQVLASMSLHAVSVCHRLATEFTSEQWASSCFGSGAAAAAAAGVAAATARKRFLARQLLKQYRVRGT